MKIARRVLTSMPIVPAFGKLKQEDMSLRLAWPYEQDTVSKQKDPKVHYSFLPAGRSPIWAPATFCLECWEWNQLPCTCFTNIPPLNHPAPWHLPLLRLCNGTVISGFRESQKGPVTTESQWLMSCIRHRVTTTSGSSPWC